MRLDSRFRGNDGTVGGFWYTCSERRALTFITGSRMFKKHGQPVQRYDARSNIPAYTGNQT